MRRLGKLGLLLVLAAALSQAAHAAIWYESYQKGQDAIRAGQWAEAVRHLNEAISLKSDSNARARTYGVQIVPYFPFLRLARALYELGRLEESAEALDREERQPAITKSPADYAELKRIRGLIQAALESRAAEEEKRNIQSLVSASLEEAGRAENQGKLDEAAAAVNKALAAAPNDQAAKDAQARIQAKIAQAARQLERETGAGDLIKEGEAQAKLPAPEPPPAAPSTPEKKSPEIASGAAARKPPEDIAKLLKQVERSFLEGNYETALADANRVLALAPDNQAAANAVLESAKALSARRPASETSATPEPVISQPDRQQFEIEPGQFVERVRDRAYDLRGSVYHNAGVKVSIGLEHYRSLRQLLSRAPARTEALREETSETKHPGLVITSYAAPLSLRPGLSVFSISVEDPSAPGTAARSSYRVYFEPPFYAATWFKGGLAGLCVILAGLAWGARRLRRKALSKRKFNPYVAGAPVLQDDLFFGRDQLLKTVLQSVHNNSIMLYGERRIGKTSFQHHLKKKLGRLDDAEYRFHPVYIDLQGVPQERFFATLRDEVMRGLAPLLEGGRETPAPADGSGYDYRQLVDDVRGVLKVLAAGSDKKIKLVLQMDEVDQLNGYDPRINQRLRSLFMRDFSESLAAVVSGVAIQKNWEGAGSPWYNFFEEIEVGPLRREDAEKLVERPVRGMFKFEKEATDHIIAVTGCKPYLIQKLCLALINRMHNAGRRTITLADVVAVARTEGA